MAENIMSGRLGLFYHVKRQQQQIRLLASSRVLFSFHPAAMRAAVSVEVAFLSVGFAA